MRSGTSYFNSHLWRKNMTRFWPIWTCYGLLWALMQPLQFLTASRRGTENLVNLARSIPETLSSGVIASFAFGLFAAMAVFSYLFSGRTACMIHSLPMDRKCLFVTNYLSGLSFLVLPNLAVAALTLLMETVYGCLAPGELVTWLLAQSATGLFFYSFAVFCAMFTGNAFALPAFYVILNFLCDAVYSLITEVLSLLLYGSWGLGGNLSQAVGWFTPVQNLSRACRYNTLNDATGMLSLNDPGAVAVYAAAAVVLALAALAVYRRRQVETAGDVVAVPLVRPVFKYGVSLCAGLAFGAVTAYLLDLFQALPLSAFVVLWAVIGYFAAEMLLRKSFRVFRQWKGAAAVACLLVLLFTAVELDWFGYESRVPSIEQVEQVYLFAGPSGAPGDSARRASMVLEQPDQISQVLRLHRAIVEHRSQADAIGEDYTDLTVSYTLTGGKVLERRYYGVPVFQADVDITGTVANAAWQMLNDYDYRRKLYDLDQFAQMRLVEVSLENLWDEKGYQEPFYLDASTSQLEQLWQAVLADFDEGTIGRRYLFENSPERMANTYTADLRFDWDTGETMRVHDAEGERTQPATQSFSITLTPQASRTLAVLEELGVLDQVTLHTHQEFQR